MFDLSAYIPDALQPQYESFRDNLVSWLRTLGVIKGSTGGDAAGRLLRRACGFGILMFATTVLSRHFACEASFGRGRTEPGNGDKRKVEI